MENASLLEVASIANRDSILEICRYKKRVEAQSEKWRILNFKLV